MRELLAGLTSADVGELLAYETIEGPVGPWRLDYLFARLLHQGATVAAAQGRSRRTFRIADFMPPWWKKPTSRKSARELQAKMEAWTAALTPRPRKG